MSMEPKFNKIELEIADKVADDILIREKKQRIFVWLFLLLFVILLTFFSSLVFSRVAYHGMSTDNYVQSGSVLYSYEEGANFINITGALPVADEIGKAMNKPNEYFEFSLSIVPSEKLQTNITYEISLTPNISTLDKRYVRVYLLEDGQEIKVNDNSVNTFSNLLDSTIRPGSKLLYKTTIDDRIARSYVFKMWVASDYVLKLEPETFSCYVNIDAY